MLAPAGERALPCDCSCCAVQDMGPHIFQTCPSANYFDCKAMSIGARSQSARTYLERLMDKFADCEMKLKRPPEPNVCVWWF